MRLLQPRSSKPLSHLLRWGVPLALYAAVAIYYRLRPQPTGVDGSSRSYGVPAVNIRFFSDTTWYDHGQRRVERQIMPEVLRTLDQARRFVVMDAFLFCLHHLDQDREFVPTTRQIADAVAARDYPAWFITDPISTSYGTAVSPPLYWLRQAGVTVCVTNLRRLRDSNLLYAPLWRIMLQWIPVDMPPRIRNPLEKNRTTTPWALLEALSARANHRKLIIADDGDSHTSLITSSNFEDCSSYFGNMGVAIRSTAVARHFLEAEKAVARASGATVPVSIPTEESTGDALVTPLMGDHIKPAMLADLDRARATDHLYVFTQFLADRELIEALVRASQRGVRGILVLDQNRVSFGNPESGFPNQLIAPELSRRTTFEIRWANTDSEEYHAKGMLLEKQDRCIIHVGSANLTRRSLSNTVLESNVRVEVPHQSAAARQALAHAAWITQQPRSLRYRQAARQHSRVKYWLCRMQAATGSGQF